MNKTSLALGIKPADRLLVVRIGTATMQFYQHAKLIKSYPISTSKRPASNVKDSLGTPRGLHEIAERIHHGAIKVDDGGINIKLVKDNRVHND